MNTQNHFTEPVISTYFLNDETRYYERATAPPDFNKIPAELKVEKTQRQEQIKSEFICRGRIVNGKYKFFTGLLPTDYTATAQLYFGDHYEFRNGQKINSFILFQFKEGNSKLIVYYFNHFKIYPNKRQSFIAAFAARYFK